MSGSDGVVELRVGRAELGVVPRIGGSIAYYRWSAGNAGQARDWLRPPGSENPLLQTADRLACFPLVPFSNRVRDGRFEFDGREVRLPLNQWPQPHAEHGHGWQCAWRIGERAANRLVLELDRQADSWPFAYRAREEFVLTEAELRVTLSAENRSRDTMPIGIGLHPYFPRTARCQLTAVVDAMWATDDEVMPTELTSADPRLARGLPVAEVALDNCFTGWRREATIVWPERRASLSIAADPPLGFLVVYSPDGEDYFCAEPVSHCTDAFNLARQGRNDTGMLTLGPGASLGASVRFRPSVA